MGVTYQTTFTCDHCGMYQQQGEDAKPEGWEVRQVAESRSSKRMLAVCPRCSGEYQDILDDVAAYKQQLIQRWKDSKAWNDV